MEISKTCHKRVFQASKVALPVSLIITLATPLLAAVATYTKTTGDVQTQFVQAKLDAAQTYVRQDEFHESITQLREMNQRLANIEGYLKASRRRDK